MLSLALHVYSPSYHKHVPGWNVFTPRHKTACFCIICCSSTELKSHTFADLNSYSWYLQLMTMWKNKTFVLLLEINHRSLCFPNQQPHFPFQLELYYLPRKWCQMPWIKILPEEECNEWMKQLDMRSCGISDDIGTE